ncbi:MAG TPA: vitamin K epoxide reductase family protein [Candidatus Paceibacterota bacterium]|nr:vitamin K epoxide reductase family protein [Candidatus Paceibacterota bacterium]
MTSLTSYLILAVCLIGLWAATHIHHKKRTKKKLVCPLHANCDKVIHSTYSTFAGIPNELLGIAYYTVIGVTVALGVLSPLIFSTVPIHEFLAILSFCGVLYSFYLVAVQILVLRAWCSWCMLSALSNVALVIILALPLL